jgi:hypothetical protein
MNYKFKLINKKLENYIYYYISSLLNDQIKEFKLS